MTAFYALLLMQCVIYYVLQMNKTHRKFRTNVPAEKKEKMAHLFFFPSTYPENGRFFFTEKKEPTSFFFPNLFFLGWKRKREETHFALLT